MDSGSAGVRAPALWLSALVVLGAVLRFYPIWFGLPYLNARPDEATALTHAVDVMRGGFNPHFFHWPSLTFYVFGAVFAVTSDVIGAVAPGAVMGDAEWLVVARCCVAVAGTATIAVLYSLARRVADAWTGLAAAGFLAVSVLHVRESHFAMTDVLMTLLATGSLALLVRAIDATEDGSGRALKWFAAAGLAGGLATSTKYNAAALVGSMAVVQLVWLVQSPRRNFSLEAWAPAAIFLAAFVTGFLAATPYAVLDSGTFVADLRFDFTHLSAGQIIDVGRGWLYHPTRSLPYGVGMATYIAALLGIIPLARHNGLAAAAIGGFALALYASVGSGLAVFFRYVLPIVPIVCLFAAVAVRLAGSWISSRTTLSARAAATIVAALIALPALANSVWFDVLLAKTDTRVLAVEWLRTRVKPDESLLEAGGLYAALDLGGVSVHRWQFDQATGSFGEAAGRLPDWMVFETSPVSTYASVPRELQRLAADRYTLVLDVPATKNDAGVYDLQDAFFLPLSGFGNVVRPGPTVTIYRRRDLPQP